MESPCICITLRKASRKLTGRYDDALAPAGINLAQFSLLRKINRHGPVSLTGLAEITDLERSTLGRNIRVLDRLGYTELRAGGDQREQSVSLSAAGKRKLLEATPLWDEAQSAVTAQLGRDNIAQLEALLGAL